LVLPILPDEQVSVSEGSPIRHWVLVVGAQGIEPWTSLV
jgi:hypothetical protein